MILLGNNHSEPEGPLRIEEFRGLEEQAIQLAEYIKIMSDGVKEKFNLDYLIKLNVEDLAELRFTHPIPDKSIKILHSKCLT